VLLPERQRIDVERRGHFVHVRFACEVVRRRRQPAIRALPERRRRGVELDTLIRDGVGRSNA